MLGLQEEPATNRPRHDLITGNIQIWNRANVSTLKRPTLTKFDPADQIHTKPLPQGRKEERSLQRQ